MKLLVVLYFIILSKINSTIYCKNCKYFSAINKFTISNNHNKIINENYGLCRKFYYESSQKTRRSENKCGEKAIYFIDKNITSLYNNIEKNTQKYIIDKFIKN